MVTLVILGVGMFVGVWWSRQRGAGGSEGVPATSSATGIGAAGFDSNELTVMTANVRISSPEDGVNSWQNRREFLVKTLLKYNADIIGCQEVTPAQGAYLIKELAGWYTHFPRAGVGSIEGQNGSRAGQLMGEVTVTFAAQNTLFYRTDRFEQVDGIAGLAVPEEPQIMPAENTFFTLAVLRDRGTGRMLIVVDTHLRYEQAFLMKCIGRIRGNIAAMLVKYPNSQVVLMGDMNHDRTSEAYQSLVSGGVGEGVVAPMPDTVGALSDAFDYSRKGPKEMWGNWHAFSGRSSRVWPSDLILTSAGLQSEGARIIQDHDTSGHYPSDHFFTLTGLRWAAKDMGG